MVPVPPSLVAIAAGVDGRLAALIDGEIARWRALDVELAAPLESLRALLFSGGKRLRPAFCHWAFVGAGGDPSAQLVTDAGAAFEFLHAFALVHDDVMDGSATRRGTRSAHLQFSDRHDRNHWSGEPRRFGEGVAILIGDLAFVYADQLLHEAPPRAWEVWNELRLELNIGQYLDVVGTATRERTRAAADRILRYKSGKYTVERPLHLGAGLAAPDRLAEIAGPLSAFGLPLGDAFQMRDDVLGTFGDESRTGKPVGDDLREGKPTPLLALATQRASAAQASVLERIGRADLDDHDIARVQQVIVDTGALSALEAEIEHRLTDALAALAAAPLTEQACRELAELAEYVARRDA